MTYKTLSTALSTMLFLLLLSGSLPAAEGQGWEWTSKEKRELKKFEKKIKEQDGYQPSPNVRKEFAGETFYAYEREEYAVYTNTNKEFAAELALYMERFVETFKDVFPIEPRGKVLNKLVVVILKNREEYKSATNRHNDEWSRGLFSPNTSTGGWPIFSVFSYVDNPQQASIDKFPLYVIQHEGTHAMIQTYSGTTLSTYIRGKWIDFLPTFVDEGCATFFEEWNTQKSQRDNEKEYDKLFSRAGLIQSYLLTNPDLEFDLGKLLLVGTGKDGSTPWSPDDGGAQTSLHYSLAQSFVHFMLSEKKYQRKFKKMFKEIYNMREPMDSKDLQELQDDWNQYLRDKLLPKPEKDS